MNAPAEAVAPWADVHTARLVMAVLREVTPDVTHVVFDGVVPPAWPSAAREAGYLEEGGDRGATTVVAVDPTSLPGDADGAADLVSRLGTRGATVVLATVSPAATDGAGRWPAFWVSPFTTAGWTFVDAIRAALWDDARVPLDCKEGLLLFVEGDAAASPALAMVHPHRAVELTMATEARFRTMLAQRVEQQALWDSLVRDIAARHDQLQLRLDLIGGRLGMLQDRLFLLDAPTTPKPPVEPTWRWIARRLLRKPATVEAAAPPPSRGVWELFDPGFYRLQVPEASNPLQHYLEVGEAQGLRPNPWFDPVFYLTQHEDVAAAGVSAFDHYCRYGGYEGRVASPEFDTAYYLAANPDVRTAGAHPLLHFMLVGRWEGRRPTPPS